MNRRQFLKKTGQAAALTALPFTLKSCASKSRPNILFIMSDDHAVQAVSCLGSQINQTPNIDRIAKEGVKFENSFCTNSICAPCRAVLLTGKFSHLNGLLDNRQTFDGSQQTFPKLLQKAGYQTVVVGKWHLKSDPTGFDYWNILPGQGHYYNPDFIEMGEKKRITGYVTDITTDIALDWLNNRDPKKPFCMLLHHKAPHRNWMPGPDHLTKYEDIEMPIPDTLFDDYATRSDAAREQEMEIYTHMNLPSDLKVRDREQIENDGPNSTFGRMNEEQRKLWLEAYDSKNEKFLEAKLEGKELAKWKYQRYIKDYLRCIASVDDNIGRVLDYLDEKGLVANTVVVYTSDQGFYLGEHGWFDKRFMYEESLRMPLVARYPKDAAPGAQISEMVQNLDFAPTFLDYAGVKVPEDMQGVSMKRLLAGKSDDWHQSIYYHYYEYPAVHQVKRHYGIRTHKYKLIHYYFDIDAWELYDLEKDPQEINNVYDNPSYTSIVQELKVELQKLREKYNDSDETQFLPKKSMKIRHKARGCDVKLKDPYAAKYSGGGPNALTDGVRAPDEITTFSDNPVWQGFEQVDLDTIIDLKKTIQINRIAVGFLHEISSWIFLPQEVKFYISEDGRNFTSVGNIENSVSNQTAKTMRKEFTLSLQNKQGRYVKVFAKNIRFCPSWHQGSGGKAWIFADEIAVH